MNQVSTMDDYVWTEDDEVEDGDVVEGKATPRVSLMYPSRSRNEKQSV